MEVAESKGILFITLIINQDEKEFFEALPEQDLIQRAREKVTEVICSSLVNEMIVGFDGKAVQVAIRL
jgi:hypothetical protein